MLVLYGKERPNAQLPVLLPSCSACSEGDGSQNEGKERGMVTINACCASLLHCCWAQQTMPIVQHQVFTSCKFSGSRDFTAAPHMPM